MEKLMDRLVYLTSAENEIVQWMIRLACFSKMREVMADYKVQLTAYLRDTSGQIQAPDLDKHMSEVYNYTAVYLRLTEDLRQSYSRGQTQVTFGRSEFEAIRALIMKEYKFDQPSDPQAASVMMAIDMYRESIKTNFDIADRQALQDEKKVETNIFASQNDVKN